MRTLFILFFVFAISMSAATTLYVNLLQVTNPANNMYHTISEAYTAAASGDVILVYPGDYFESINASRSITLTIMGTTQSSSRIITNNSIGISITSGSLTIKNLYFKSSGSSGIKLSNSCPAQVIRNCIFESCGNGILVSTTTTITISNSVFRSCANGLLVDTFQNDVFGSVSNCVFHDNTKAIHFDADYSGRTYSIDIFNSVFFHNGHAIYKYSSPAYNGTFGYCSLFNSTVVDTYGVTWGPGNISNDPSLTNIASSPYFNYFPMPGSPCINAGNPNLSYNDLDNTRNDIGIYGGPYQWGDGKPVVLDMQLTPNPVQQGGTINIQATGQTK